MWWSLLGVPVVLLVLAGASLLFLDLPIARYCSLRAWPDVIQKTLYATEPFGTVFGQGLILIAIYWLCPTDRRRLLRMGVAATVAGLTANVLKLTVARTRPKYLDLGVDSIVEGFNGFFPLLGTGSAHQSLPSAHTASAVAFAVLLGARYPRGRVFFLCIAAGVAMQRMISCSHFLSDVLCGAAVGWIVGHAFLRPWKSLAMFDRFEQGGLVQNADADHV